MTKYYFWCYVYTYYFIHRLIYYIVIHLWIKSLLIDESHFVKFWQTWCQGRYSSDWHECHRDTAGARGFNIIWWEWELILELLCFSSVQYHWIEVYLTAVHLTAVHRTAFRLLCYLTLHHCMVFSLYHWYCACITGIGPASLVLVQHHWYDPASLVLYLHHWYWPSITGIGPTSTTPVLAQGFHQLSTRQQAVDDSCVDYKS